MLSYIWNWGCTIYNAQSALIYCTRNLANKCLKYFLWSTINVLYSAQFGPLCTILKILRFSWFFKTKRCIFYTLIDIFYYFLWKILLSKYFCWKLVSTKDISILTSFVGLIIWKVKKNKKNTTLLFHFSCIKFNKINIKISVELFSNTNNSIFFKIRNNRKELIGM